MHPNVLLVDCSYCKYQACKNVPATTSIQKEITRRLVIGLDFYNPKDHWSLQWKGFHEPV